MPGVASGKEKAAEGSAAASNSDVCVQYHKVVHCCAGAAVGQHTCVDNEVFSRAVLTSRLSKPAMKRARQRWSAGTLG